MDFETKSFKETSNDLDVDISKGLNSTDLNARKEKYGENKLDEGKKKSLIKIFFSQMKNPMIYVLFAAVAVTIGISIYETIKAARDPSFIGNLFLDVGDWPDVIIIFAVIILNSIIGTIQESKAASSLEALKKLSAPLVNVIRDGENKRIKSTELTVGDIVILSEGDMISADMRLVESYNLKVNESSLTGESLPVSKNADIVLSKATPIGDRINMVFSSTVVTYGRGKAIVTSIGMNTEIGKIAHSLSEDEQELTPLQKVLNKLSKFLGIITIVIVVVVLAVLLTWIFVDGRNNNINAFIDAVLSSIALAVAAIPEGLVAVVTIVLAIGVSRMVKANTIVRKLPSVETLGSVNTICSDKTGTLTQNKMTVVKAYTNFNEYIEFKNDKSIDFLSKGLCLCSDATLTFGDPTEIALVAFADKLGFKKEDLEKELPRINELPFDSVRKMMSISNKEYIFTKGAIDSILSHTSKILVNDKVRAINKSDLDNIEKINNKYSSEALRVLALAYKPAGTIKEEDLIFVGLVAMIDPPREEVKDAVSKLKGAGINTIMITGDYKDTAFAIAKQLGIAKEDEEILSGVELDKLSKEELKEKVKTVHVFARVSPQNKVDIVKAIKANDLVVAMTGDGVNDAPSLKSADIGIAMGITGTDVAKDASDMILTDDNFASIEKAVEEGRGIFTNIKKAVLFLLSSNIAEVLSMFLVVCVGIPSPFIAIHLLWINLISDSMPAIALGMDPKEDDVMKEKPRSSKDSFFSHGGLNYTLLFGGIITIVTLIAFLIPAWEFKAFSFASIKSLYLTRPDILASARTMAFLTLGFGELFHMLGMSSMNKSFIHIFKNKNKMLYIAFLVGVLLQVFVVVTPGVNTVFKTTNVSYQFWLISLALSLAPLLVHELIVLIKKLTKNKK